MVWARLGSNDLIFSGDTPPVDSYLVTLYCNLMLVNEALEEKLKEIYNHRCLQDTF